MKVLMLGWELPPFNSGGLGVACLHLSKALASSGADIDFVLPYYPGPQMDHMNVITMFKDPEEFDRLPGIYDELGAKDGLPPAVNQADDAFEKLIGRIVSQQSYDIIHAHDWLTFRAALRAKWLTNKPLVLHVHSIERDRAGGKAGSPLVREIEFTAMHLADKVIAVSEHTKRAIVEDYKIPANKIAVVHNGINPSDFEPLDDANAYVYLELMKARGWKVLSYVGRLTIQKGLTQLIQAAAKAMRFEPNTLLLVVGGGEQRDQLISLSADLGIGDRVIFTDFQRGKRLRDAYRATDLFMMPSVSEPFGLVALEAAGYGAPVLVSKQSGVSEALKSCLKVDFWDVDEMANKIVSVLRNQSLANELSGNALAELDSMSWERPARKVMRLYFEHAGAPA